MGNVIADIIQTNYAGYLSDDQMRQLGRIALYLVRPVARAYTTVVKRPLDGPLEELADWAQGGKPPRGITLGGEHSEVRIVEGVWRVPESPDARHTLYVPGHHGRLVPSTKSWRYPERDAMINAGWSLSPGERASARDARNCMIGAAFLGLESLRALTRAAHGLYRHPSQGWGHSDWHRENSTGNAVFHAVALALDCMDTVAAWSSHYSATRLPEHYPMPPSMPTQRELVAILAAQMPQADVPAYCAARTAVREAGDYVYRLLSFASWPTRGSMEPPPTYRALTEDTRERLRQMVEALDREWAAADRDVRAVHHRADEVRAEAAAIAAAHNVQPAWLPTVG